MEDGKISLQESLIMEDEDKKEIQESALLHVKNMINLEKNPFKNIFFQFNDKEIPVHTSQLKEDVSEDKALNTFKKAIMLGANLGSTQNALYKSKK